MCFTSNLLFSLLSILDFIRRNRDKFDWRILAITNDFSDDEKEEFDEVIPNYKEEWEKYEKENSNVGNTQDIPQIISVKDIRKLINANISDKVESKRFEVKHTMDDITNDDLLQIKEIIQSGKANKF